MLRVYQIQREEFLPSAHATIFSFTVLVVVLLAFTKIGTEAETLVTVAFLSFFFVYLLLLDVISKPFKVGWPPSPRRWPRESPSSTQAPTPTWMRKDRVRRACARSQDLRIKSLSVASSAGFIGVLPAG